MALFNQMLSWGLLDISSVVVSKALPETHNTRWIDKILFNVHPKMITAHLINDIIYS